jgi:hypothetical protein
MAKLYRPITRPRFAKVFPLTLLKPPGLSNTGPCFMWTQQEREELTSIKCCGIERLARVTTLLPSRTPDIYTGELLIEVWCGRCKKTVLGWAGLHPIQGQMPVKRLETKEHAEWIKRKKTETQEVEKHGEKAPRDTRPLVIISEYSLKAARDPADSVRCA